MLTDAPQNCRLELSYGHRGFIRRTARLSLVDEFNNKTYYSVVPQVFNTNKDLIVIFAKATICIAVLRYLTQDLTLAPLTSLALDAFLGSTIGNLATLGSSKFMRSNSSSEYSLVVRNSIDLTREQYLELRNELRGKKKIYTPSFSNCVQQSRREFNAIQKRLYPDLPSEPVYRNPFRKYARAVSS